MHVNHTPTIGFRRIPVAVIFLAVCVLGALGVFGAEAWADDLPVTVQSHTGTPFEGVSVYAFTESGSYTGYSATTDTDGVATFDSDDFGTDTHMFRVDYLGHQFRSDVVVIQEITQLTVEIETAQVLVTVTAADNLVPDIKVYLYNDEDSIQNVYQVTDETGEASFELPTGVGFKFRADVLGSMYYSDESIFTAGGDNTVNIDTGGGTLTITLLSDTQTPISGSKVYLLSTDGSYFGTYQTSDDAGQVSFDVSEASYKVGAKHLGYEFRSDEISVSADTDVDFSIPHQDITITVSGNFDGGLTPIEGVNTNLFTSSESWVGLSQSTDADGRVTFFLPDQAYKIRVDYMGYQFWSDEFQSEDTTVNISMADAEVTVSGSGMPKADVKIYAYSSTGTYLGLYDETDENGKAVFRLPAESYKFKVYYLGNEYWSDVTQLTAGEVNPVTVSTGGGTFVLTVKKDTDTPLEGDTCYVYTENDSSIGIYDTTDADGNVSFNLPEGNFKILVKHLGYEYWSDIYTVPDTLAETFTISHQDITITVNGEFDGLTPMEGLKTYLYTSSENSQGLYQITDADGQVTFSLPDQAYKVRVNYMGYQFWSEEFQSEDTAVNIPMADAEVQVYGSGLPTAGVEIYVYSSTGDSLGLSESTDADGKVVFRLPAEAYKFKVIYQKNIYWSEVTQLTAGEVNTVAVSTGGGTFVLTVKKDADTPIEGAKCYVFSESGSYIGLYAVTDEDGNVSLDLAEGNFKIRVGHMGYYFWTDIYTVPDTLAETFIIPHAQVTFTFHGDPDGGPHEGVRSYLYTAAGSYAGEYRITDENGQVTFDLPERSYNVRFNYLGYQFWLEDIFESGDAAIDMPIDQKAVTITVDGIYEDSEPLEDVKVYLFTEDECYVGLYDSTNAAGQVVFDLPDKDYKVRVDYLGYQFWSDTIRFEDALVEIDMGRVLLHATSDGEDLDEAKIYLFSADGNYQNRYEYTDTEGAAEFLLPDRSYKFLYVQGEEKKWTPEITVVAGETAIVEAAYDTEMTAILSVTPETIIKGETATLAWLTENIDTCSFTPDTGDVDTDGTLEVSPEQTTTYTLTADGPTGTKTLSVTMEVIEEIKPRTVEFPDAVLVGGDSYQLFVGNSSPYSVTGVYYNIDGEVTVTAKQDDITLTVSGSAGNLSVDLTSAGSWYITVANTDGTEDATALLEVIVDDAGPDITLDGSDQRTTTEDFIQLSGTVTDAVSGLDTVFVTSDRYPDQEFGVIVTTLGAFSTEIPLAVGENNLIVTARDNSDLESQVAVTVTVTVSARPTVTIITPEDGVVVLSDRVDVTGTVRSSLDPDQIRLTLGDQLIFPSGEDYEYSFTFEDVSLSLGRNVLIVQAETVYGDATDQVLVYYAEESDTEEASTPTIDVYSPLADNFLTEDPVVKGMAYSDLGIASVSVNGEEATLIGADTAEASFEKALSFPETGDDEMEIAIIATDGAGGSQTLTYSVTFDNTPPVITLSDTDIAQPPAVNTVVDSTYDISGQVVEKNLAGLTLNDQNIDVLPGADTDTWTFSTAAALTADAELSLTLTAWDYAGQQTSTEWIVQREGGVDIEVINPRNNVELESEEETLSVTVTARLTGAEDTDVAWVQIDDDDPVSLARSGDFATTEITVDATQEEHILLITVEDDAGEMKGHLQTQFTILNTANVPLAVQRLEPANGDTGVEPNGFIAFYFNKAVEMEKLEVQVKETAHGLVYAEKENGADLTQFNEIELVEVHRDQETVPGGLAGFPGNVMAAFYAERDFAYGATIYVTLLYDGEEISRSSFTIRPLPTFIQGIVVDQFKEPIAGIEISIPELDRTAVTDDNGSYGFGFDDTADTAIPGGRYRALINPDLDNRTFGSQERWINVEEGRLNEVGVSVLSVLSTQTPFYRVTSNTADQILAQGDLILDTSAAELFFPDGRNQGDIHVQFMELSEIEYPTMGSAMPHWAYNLQPMGIEVSGEVDMTFTMPSLYGSYDYVDNVGDYVILVGLDPDALQLVPVGVGLVDAGERKVTSAVPVALERLDYLGYALLAEDQKEIVESFVSGDIGLAEMIGELEK